MTSANYPQKPKSVRSPFELIASLRRLRRCPQQSIPTSHLVVVRVVKFNCDLNIHRPARTISARRQAERPRTLRKTLTTVKAPKQTVEQGGLSRAILARTTVKGRAESVESSMRTSSRSLKLWNSTDKSLIWLPRIFGLLRSDSKPQPPRPPFRADAITAPIPLSGNHPTQGFHKLHSVAGMTHLTRS